MSVSENDFPRAWSALHTQFIISTRGLGKALRENKHYEALVDDHFVKLCWKPVGIPYWGGGLPWRDSSSGRISLGE